MRLTLSRRDSRRAAGLGEKAGCTVARAGEGGVPAFLLRFRRRYALLVGMALSLAAVCVLSQFVLWVEVSGNETVPTAEILTELRRLGLRPGTYGPGVDESEVSRGLLLRLDGLAWCAVNLHGTRAEVLVRETVPTPELPDDSLRGSVVAKAPGIVTGMEVLEGDVLIAGDVAGPVPQYSELEPPRRLVKAEGRIYARTWRTLTASIPLTADVKTYTGEEESRWSLHILGLRINFYGNSGISFPEYDKITEVWTARLPSGQELPLWLSRETARAYERTGTKIDPEAAQTLLEERLLADLTEQVGEGEIVSTAYTARQAGGVLTVTLTAECREEIGTFVPFPDGYVPGGGAEGGGT